ncbi:MAG: HAD-IA family hydrolase [Desulfovibrionaceae bacterium]|nr:HAD-IA family hydrolase [Desulfovibrionaceae bacterium]
MFHSPCPDACLDATALAGILSRLYERGPDGIIFDCDGVLVDSAPTNIHYYNLLRERLGLPPMSEEQERYVHMSTVAQAIEAIIPAPMRPALREVSASVSYTRDILPLVTPFEGLRELLDACRGQGLRLGVHTNRLSTMPELLAHCDFTEYFDPVITVARAQPKPHPEGTLLVLEHWGMPPERALFVGDSSTDRDAARAAGVPFLAFRADDLSPQGCCCAYRDLLAALRSLWAA